MIVRVSENYYRPSEVETLLGDPSLALKELGWTAKHSIGQLVESMMVGDLNEAKKLSILDQHDYFYARGFES